MGQLPLHLIKETEMNNKTLALLRNAYDDNHGWIITIEDPDRIRYGENPTYKKSYKMTEYLKAWRYFEESKFKYHRDKEIEIANIYVR